MEETSSRLLQAGNRPEARFRLAIAPSLSQENQAWWKEFHLLSIILITHTHSDLLGVSCSLCVWFFFFPPLSLLISQASYCAVWHCSWCSNSCLISVYFPSSSKGERERLSVLCSFLTIYVGQGQNRLNLPGSLRPADKMRAERIEIDGEVHISVSLSPVSVSRVHLSLFKSTRLP